MMRKNTLQKTVLVAIIAPAHLAMGPVELASQEGANIQRPQWSDDGTQLAYEANHHKTKRIETFVGHYPSGPFTQVTPRAQVSSGLATGFQNTDSNTNVVHELCWAPSSLNQYVVSASNTLGDYDLYFRTSPYSRNQGSADGGCTWSPDGRFIAFTSARTGSGDLYVIDIQALEAPPLQVTDAPLAAEVYPTWSGDSKSLVFVTHTNDGDHLWWLPSIRHQPIRLTRGTSSQTRPRFSPTGNHVAYYEQSDTEEQLNLCFLEIGAPTDPKCIAQDVVPNTTGPIWSTEGTHLLYTKNNDAAFDPIEAVDIRQPKQRYILPLSTVGHGDLDVHTNANGDWVLAYIAQGSKTDATRTFKKLYIATIPRPSTAP